MHAIVLFLAAATAPATAVAANPAPASLASTQVDPARLAAAQRLLDAADTDKMMSNMIDQMAVQHKVMLTNSLRSRTGEEPDPGLIEAVSAVTSRFLRTQLTADYPQLRSVIASIYARHLSVDDMDRVAEMQADPAIKRFQDKLPAMLGEIAVVMGNWSDAHRDEVKADVMKAIEDYEAKHEGS